MIMIQGPSELKEILSEYQLEYEYAEITPVSQGLINTTWKITSPSQTYILQKVNQNVFRKPEDIAHNIDAIGAHLEKCHPDYLFVRPIETTTGKTLFRYKHGDYYRLFPFVKNSHTVSVLKNPEQAYVAAAQFGQFTYVLKDFDSARLKVTIPSFHNLDQRYKVFKDLLIQGNPARIKQAKSLIIKMSHHENLVRIYRDIVSSKDFYQRVTHHDTKISNVLFDKDGKGLCVIDLDTVMAGYCISDLGDMFRTYLCPVDEEESDFEKIEVRKEYYQAIVEGYMSHMSPILSEKEKNHLFYAGTFMIFMQALRFVSDFLNDDSYYETSYPGQNLIRASNQMILLERLIQKEKELSGIIH